MGGTKRKMKTKWRRVSLAELSESLATGKETDIKSENAENADPSLNSQQTKTEFSTSGIPIEEGMYSHFVDGYDFPQGITYPSPPYFYFNRMGMPVYPNFVIPSDMMYRQFYVSPPTEMASDTPVQQYNSSMHATPGQQYTPSVHTPSSQGYNPSMQASPGQEYNSSMHATPGQQYTPSVHIPSSQGYNPSMQASPGQEFNPSMQFFSGQAFNPTMQAPTGEGYPPMQAPTGEGYPPMQGPTGEGYPPMQGPTGEGYPPMQGPTGEGYPPMQVPLVQEYIPSMYAPPGQEYNPLMHIPPVQEYNPMQFQAPHAKDPVLVFFPAQQVYASHARGPPLTDFRNRRRRFQHGRYGASSFTANRNQRFGNEEERYGSTVLRPNRRSGAAANPSSHGNTMTSEANSSGREGQRRKEETNEKRSFVPEEGSTGPRSMASPIADRNGNGKSQINPKFIRKTEFCGTHAVKTQEKGDSTNNFKFDQEKSNVSGKSPRGNSSTEVSKNKKITISPSEGNSPKGNSENETMPKTVIDSIEGVSNGNEMPDIATAQPMSVSFEGNCDCKGTDNSQAMPVECGNVKEAVEVFNNNVPNNTFRLIKINNNEGNVFGSVDEHSSQDDKEELQETNKCNLNHENSAKDENLSEDENVAANESIVAKTVAKHSSPDNNKEMHDIKKSNLDYENVPENDNVADSGTLAEHSSQDNDKELQEIDKCNMSYKNVEKEENVAVDKSDSSDSDIYAVKEEPKSSQNQPRSPYPNSSDIVPEIVNTVPKALSTDFVVPVHQFVEYSSSKLTGIITSREKSPVVPRLPNSEASTDETKLNPKQDFTAPKMLSPVPKISNSIPKTAVSETNEDSAKTNQLDEKAMKPTTSAPQSSNSEAFNAKNDIEMKQLTSLQSMKPNQSIYKLAYNESITSSETNSRSLSSVDSEIYIPSSIINDEINVYAADSDSDAGSEDIELIPHRYESETFKNQNKNVYVNKLSLAVELLRTQESLPYDDHFRRVVDDIDASAEDTTGEVNLGFDEDFSSVNTSMGQNMNTTHECGREVVVTSPGKSNNLPANSGAASNVVNVDDFNNSCEEAKEKVVAQSLKNRDATEEVKAANRRYKVHLRHYFTPRASLINPCLCCVIM